MEVLLNIPNYEFNNDVKDKFQDYFNRVKADIANGTLCGNYELETTDMFLASFKRMQVLPDNATNGDMIKAIFPNGDFHSKETEGDWWRINHDNRVCYEIDYRDLWFDEEWWNAPYYNNK